MPANGSHYQNYPAYTHIVEILRAQK
jgi:hypothetical protein